MDKPRYDFFFLCFGTGGTLSLDAAQLLAVAGRENAIVTYSDEMVRQYMKRQVSHILPAPLKTKIDNEQYKWREVEAAGLQLFHRSENQYNRGTLEWWITMETSENNRRIAKNTAFLYIRMLFTMIVTLFTSRIILQSLGIVDYGIYNVVGGTVALFSFINLTLSGAASRFLTYDLGTGKFEKLKETFSTTLSVHIIIIVVVLILAETVGLWFMYNKVNIPFDRVEIALLVYQISIFTSIVSILQTPFTASIISHEDMNIYAYVSIAECIAKLGIAYIIFIVSLDKLVVYSVLLLFFALIICFFYISICMRKYPECSLKPLFKSGGLRPILVYSVLQDLV